MTTKFNIGDFVWIASIGNHLIEKVCPVCFGKLKIQVILGNEEVVETPCEFCKRGYEGPFGYIKEYEWGVNPQMVEIKSIELTSDGILFNFSKEKEFFKTKEEALVRCEEKKIEAEREQKEKNVYLKDKDTKSYSWHVGYHRREINKLQKQIDYHRGKVVSMGKLAEKYKRE